MQGCHWRREKQREAERKESRFYSVTHVKILCLQNLFVFFYTEVRSGAAHMLVTEKYKVKHVDALIMPVLD